MAFRFAGRRITANFALLDLLEVATRHQPSLIDWLEIGLVCFMRILDSIDPLRRYGSVTLRKQLLLLFSRNDYCGIEALILLPFALPGAVHSSADSIGRLSKIQGPRDFALLTVLVRHPLCYESAVLLTRSRRLLQKIHGFPRVLCPPKDSETGPWPRLNPGSYITTKVGLAVLNTAVSEPFPDFAGSHCAETFRHFSVKGRRVFGIARLNVHTDRARVSDPPMISAFKLCHHHISLQRSWGLRCSTGGLAARLIFRLERVTLRTDRGSRPLHASG